MLVYRVTAVTRGVQVISGMDVDERDASDEDETCGPAGRIKSSGSPPALSAEELRRLGEQLRRPVAANRAAKLEADAARHWDLFYKRNGTKFFKDRHWTVREFGELLPTGSERLSVLEAGCGVGNLVFPLLEDESSRGRFRFYACDLSPRAVDFVKANPLYDEAVVTAFRADVTVDDLAPFLPPEGVDVVTLVFTLSAIHPDKFDQCLRRLRDALKPGGVLLFRDYGLYDITQLRFKPGHMISENFYARQDGTRSYFFRLEELRTLFASAGFEVASNDYVERRTINRKENVDAPRNFVQGKFRKPKII